MLHENLDVPTLKLVLLMLNIFVTFKILLEY